MESGGLTGEGTVVETYDVAPPSRAAQARKQLRIALAMRGGVSLAVWIGGAVTEIERLRQHAHPANEIYRTLLEINGYNDVIVDVVSGASAGGLNGVVYSAAQVHGFDMGALRDLWLSLGDIEMLARPTTAGGRAKSAREANLPIDRGEALRPSSLLRGDEYFYRSIRHALSDQIERVGASAEAAAAGDVTLVVSPVAAKKADRLDLLLSATLFEPKTVKKLVNRTTVIEDGRSNALFRFVHSDTRHDLDNSREVMDRLGMAARTTSSFPGAFEPARIGVGRGAAQSTERIDFAAILEVPRTEDDSGLYELIDGGVLDNIPVAAAIRAVVDAPADGPTDRWLCYLHPSPSGSRSATAAKAPSAAPRFVSTAVRTFSTRFNQESLLQDVDELTLVNDLLARRRRLRDTLLAPFGSADYQAVRDDVTMPLKAAVLEEMLAQFEAHRIRENLERPDRLRLLEPLPFVTSWPAELQTEIAQALVSAQGVRVRSLAHAPTITLLAEATELLIAHARTIENDGDVPAAAIASAGGVKATLYAMRSRLDKVVRDEAETWAAKAVATFFDPVTADLGGVAGWVTAVLDETTAAAAGEVASLWEGVVAAASDLVAIQVALPAPFCLLANAPVTEVASALESLVLLLLPVRLLGHGPWSPLTFVYLNGDAPTTLAFDALTTGEPLRSRQKLAGNELANFSAFLSATWRANDWMWGRMDAASTLVGELCGPRVLGDSRSRVRVAELAGLEAGVDDETIVAAIRDKLQLAIFEAELATVKSTPASAIDNLRPPADLRQETYDIGNETLGDLGERRRTRVGMRMAHLAYAALRPSGGTNKARAVRVAASIFKPLYLVAMFAYLSPARAFLALAIGASSVQATFWRGDGDASLTWDEWSSFLVITTVVALAVLGGRKAYTNRLQQDRNTDDPWVSVSLGVAGLAGVAAALAVVREAGPQYIALGCVNLAIIALAVSTLVRRVRGGNWAAVTLVVWTLALVAAAAGIIFGWVHPLWDGQQDQWTEVKDLIYLLVPAAVLASVIGSSWMRWWAMILAAALSFSVGLGSLTITTHRDRAVFGLEPPVWAWIAVVMLSLIYVSDVAQMWRHLHFGNGETRSSLLPGALLWIGALAAVTYACTTRDFSVPMGGWAVIAVALASYGNVALATHVPVFEPPKPLDLEGRVSRTARRV